MQNLIEALLQSALSTGQMQQLNIGINWTLAVIQDVTGSPRAGLAASPPSAHFALQTRFQPGENLVKGIAAGEMAQLLKSPERVANAVGLATLNALLEPDPLLLQAIDAADWLGEHGRNQTVAMIGRFPFILELQPIVKKLLVFELNPQPGEYHADEAPHLIPQADIVAITSSTIVNHTLAGILKSATPHAKVMLLGPSTPLTPVLFDWGVNMLFGIQVLEVETVASSLVQGVSFRHMSGVRRVCLAKFDGS